MCGGFCKRFCHWGPIIAIGIVKWISLATVYSNTMWWPLESGWGAVVNMFVFLTFSSLTSFHFFCAMCDGPGYLPLKWKPENSEEEKYLQYCDACEGYKAPRAHHCRKCNRCVMKMDHHCPWINNCVGHFNHGHFIGFLFFAVVGSAQATITLSMTLYYGLNRSWYHYYGTGLEPKVTLTIWTLLLVMFALGLAIGVVLAVGALLFFQVRAAWRNQTGIEDWILDKAEYRRRDTDHKFNHPYFLGNWMNLKQVLTFTCIPHGNGIEWNLREGASKYDLTVEQLEQKSEKRQRTKEYKIVKEFTGSWLPFWSHGFKVATHPPCTDEARISLSKGDLVRVTRWKRYWLYGDKAIKQGSQQATESTGGLRVRGWFPRHCAVEAIDDVQTNEEPTQPTQTQPTKPTQPTKKKKESKKVK